MLPQSDELIATLNMYGLADVSKHIKKMTEKTSKRSPTLVIPAFNDLFSIPSSDFGKILSDYIGEQRIEAYKKTIIARNEISKIQSDMSLNEVKAVFSSELENIFTDNVIARFKMIDGKFDTALFKTFLSQISNVQNGILTMIEIDPWITRTISQDTLRSFILETIPKLKSLAPLEKDYGWYKEFYVEIVVSIFFFFFSDYNCMNLNATTLFQSKLFSSFVNMDMIPSSNIFSIKSTTIIYKSYVNENSNEDGLIGRENLKDLLDYKFSDVFLDRLFEILPTFEGKFDFCAYVSFVVALQNIQTKQGIRFFFKIVDIDEDGYVSRNDISYFYKCLVDETGFTEINEDRFISELFDTVSCSGRGVTINHLLKIGATTFFLKLIDINTFKEWENLNA